MIVFNKNSKQLTNSVWERTYKRDGFERSILLHQCDPTNDNVNEMSTMILRQKEEGPLYWCTGCGFVLDDGVAMAIRLNQVDI